MRVMIYALLRVVIKYVFGLCMVVQFVVPGVVWCAFFRGQVFSLLSRNNLYLIVQIPSMIVDDVCLLFSWNLYSIVIESERVVLLEEEKWHAMVSVCVVNPFSSDKFMDI